MNNALEDLSLKQVESYIEKNKLVSKNQRNEEIVKQLHKLKLFFLNPWVIIVAIIIVLFLISGAFYVYYWKKDQPWIFVIDNILNWGIPSLLTYLFTKKK